METGNTSGAEQKTSSPAITPDAFEKLAAAGLTHGGEAVRQVDGVTVTVGVVGVGQLAEVTLQTPDITQG